MDSNESTGVASESQAAFPEATDTQTTTATDSSSETKQPETTQVAPEAKQKADERPWHQDPRFREDLAKLKDYDNLKKTVDELLPLKDIASKFNAPAPQIPKWFSGIYGNDQAAWDDYNSHTKSIKDQIKAEVIAEYEGKQKAQQDAIAEATKHFEDSVAELTADGTSVDKNKLLKFVMDNDLVDSQGKWNYKAGFKFMRDLERMTKDAQQEPVTEAKKQIADQTTQGSKEKKAKGYETRDSLRNKSWYSL